MERIEFKNKKEQNIIGILHEPNNNKEEITIIIHGFGSTKNTASKEISELLEKENINSFRIDLDNRGESEPDFNKEASINNYSETVKSAIKLMKEKGYAKYNLIGTSFGGIVCMNVAANNKEINKLCLRASVGNYWELWQTRASQEQITKWKEEGSYTFKLREGETKINFNCLEEAKDKNFFEQSENISCQTLILHGTGDKQVPHSHGIKLVEKIPNSKLILIHGANHGLAVEKNKSESMHYILDFLQK